MRDARAEGQPAEQSPPRYLGRGYQAAVFVEGSGADRRVIKVTGGRGIAGVLRRAMLRHEYRVYQQLGLVDGVPRCLGLRADGGLALQYLDAEAFHESAPALRDRTTFFRQLLALIQAIHAKGIAHADLKRRGNILIDQQGRPWIVDFGTALRRTTSTGRIGGFLFEQARRMDLNAWVKLKYRRRYDEIADEDRGLYAPTVIENIARPVRRAWRKLTARQFRKAWRRRRQR
jgi:predicted Ser/Thr protein kinase